MTFQDLISSLEGLVFEAFGEVGFGSLDVFGDSINYTTAQFGFIARYEFPLSDSVVAYPLAGPSYMAISFNDCDLCEVADGIGLQLGGGVRFGAIGVEAAVGIGDNQDFRVVAKYTFGLD